MVAWLLVSLAVAGGLPEVEVAFERMDGTLRVRGPAGEHVAPDAPAYLTARWEDRDLSFAGLGADLARGVPLAAVTGAAFSGELRVSLCEDGGSTCRVVDVALRGAVPPARKGVVALSVGAPTAAGTDHGPYRSDAASAAAAAFADAAARGLPVLLDFTAVWCPPCNLLTAEVLHAPSHADVLDDYVLLQIDVDDPTSWALKDRYEVGGYPTLVIADAAGTLRDRVEGYPGEEATVAWLVEVSKGQATAADTPEVAARTAWTRLRRGDLDAATALLERAAGAEDTVPFRLTRVSLSPSIEDVRWLTARAPEHAAAWLYAARKLAADPDGAEAVREAIRAGLRHAAPSEAADLLYLRGQIDGGDDAVSWYAAAAAAQRAGFTGDPQRDRAYWTWYARLLQLAGGADEALAFLDDARAAFPDEPTWALAAGDLLNEEGRHDEAIARVDRDWAWAWGDNRLRMAMLKVEALRALGRSDEARTFGEAVLAEIPEPADAVDVRTRRYRAALREGIGAEVDASTR